MKNLTIKNNMLYFGGYANRRLQSIGSPTASIEIENIKSIKSDKLNLVTPRGAPIFAFAIEIEAKSGNIMKTPCRGKRVFKALEELVKINPKIKISDDLREGMNSYKKYSKMDTKANIFQVTYIISLVIVYSLIMSTIHSTVVKLSLFSSRFWGLFGIHLISTGIWFGVSFGILTSLLLIRKIIPGYIEYAEITQRFKSKNTKAVLVASIISAIILVFISSLFIIGLVALK